MGHSEEYAKPGARVKTIAVQSIFEITRCPASERAVLIVHKRIEHLVLGVRASEYGASIFQAVHIEYRIRFVRDKADKVTRASGHCTRFQCAYGAHDSRVGRNARQKLGIEDRASRTTEQYCVVGRRRTVKVLRAVVWILNHKSII